MTEVFVGVGSNVDRYRHVSAALEALDAAFGPLSISPVYQSAAVGFDGDDFLNLVVGFNVDCRLGELAGQLRAIESANGRVRGGPRFAARTLDLDILTYGDAVGEIDGVTLPRDEILHNAFVLRPLADLAGERRHPQTGVSYAEHWAAYDQASQRLAPVTFRWRGREISIAGD